MLEASLTALSFDRTFSSPLQRARRTAELAVPHARIEEDDDLMEWDYGAYEGKPTADLEVERPGWRLSVTAAPAAKRSARWVRVLTASSVAFALQAAMSCSSPIVSFCAF